ncbi:MAG: hypothetical protein O3C34_10690 [Proteobacteria bacterium]|nr:hypothetical protein [Pseudomonadota bacterium]
MAVGFIVTLPSAGRLAPPSIETLSAPVVVQAKVVDPPDVIVSGLAVKLSIVGGTGEAGLTVTVADRVTPPLAPEIVAVVVAVTEVVPSVKVRLVVPAATVRLAGTVTAAVLLESVTTDPPLGATELKVTVRVKGSPPTTLVGFTDSAASVGVGTSPGLISKSAVGPGELAPSTREPRVKLNVLVTGAVVIAKLALVAPAGTVTLAGTVAGAVGGGGWRVMIVAPLCAALRVTVPVAELPPTTLVGLTDNPDSSGGGGSNVRVALRLEPRMPEIVSPSVVFSGITLVFTVKLALVAPAGTVTLVGTVAATLLLDSVTTAPPLGAAPLKVTVPVTGLPPTTLVGLTDNAEIVGPSTGGVTTATPNLVTKPSPQSGKGSPSQKTSRAPGVVGKSAE